MEFFYIYLYINSVNMNKLKNIIVEGYKEHDEMDKLTTEIIKYFAEKNIATVNRFLKKNIISFNYDFALIDEIANVNNYSIIADFIRNSNVSIELDHNVKLNSKADYSSQNKQIKIYISNDNEDSKNNLNSIITPYLNDDKQVEYEDSFKIIKTFLGVSYRNDILHELQHAYDDYRSDNKYRTDKESIKYYKDVKSGIYKEDSKMTPEEFKIYSSLPHEYWARFSESLNDLHYDIRSKNKSFNDIYNRFKTTIRGWENISPDNQKRVLKALYGYYNLINGKEDKLAKKLVEAEYNYHIGDLDVDNVKPYGSDSKNIMRGRDTGHFGSGLYFSTYNSKYKNDDLKNPELINIKDNVYRVDFDLYKNLYKVKNELHGDLLFKTLQLVNSLYNIISDYYKYNEKLPNDFSKRYLILKNNSNKLGLKCPEYNEFIKMCKDLYSNKTKQQSMSTIFMEYNDYNGVNVSGIDKYDNTLHGSVIYNISKVSDKIKKIDTNRFNSVDIVDGDYVGGDFTDFKDKLLLNKDVVNIYVDEFNKLDKNTQTTIIKKYKYSLWNETLEKIDPGIKNFYFKTLAFKIKNGFFDKKNMINIIKTIINNNQLDLLYNKNISFENKTLLSFALENIHYFDVNDEDLIISNINRELTQEERKELNDINKN
jgi:hypothetical protein